MTPLRFVLRNAPILGFGLVLTFASSFGQTFFVSLFVPHMKRAFDLDSTAFGSIYAGATIASALTIPFLGRYIDRAPARLFAALTFLGLGLCATLAGSAQTVVIIAIALYGIRLFGQGLSSLLAATTIARYFESGRGLALGIMSLGFPLAESILPSIFTALIAAFGWRQSWFWAAGFIAIVLLPIAIFILGKRKTDAASFRIDPALDLQSNGNHRPEVRSWTRGQFFTSPAALALLPSSLFFAFTLTGLFFHQLALAEEKQWTATYYAASFVGFAIARGCGSFFLGPLVDRFSGTKIYPLTIIPFAIGLLVLALFDGLWVAPVYLSLCGLAVGSGGPARASMLAERFGLLHLGAIKSSMMPLGVLSAAVAPPIFGYLIDRGISFSFVAAVLGVGSIVVLLMAWLALRVLSGQPNTASDLQSTA